MRKIGVLILIIISCNGTTPDEPAHTPVEVNIKDGVIKWKKTSPSFYVREFTATIPAIDSFRTANKQLADSLVKITTQLTSLGTQVKTLSTQVSVLSGAGSTGVTMQQVKELLKKTLDTTKKTLYFMAVEGDGSEANPFKLK